MSWFGDGARLSRRGLVYLLGSGALAQLVRPGVAQASALDLSDTEFLFLSERLCGLAPDDPSLAGAVQAAVAVLHPVGALRRLADLVAVISGNLDFAIDASGLAEPASSVVAIWYSGLTGDSAGARVLTYNSALGWAATGFAKPNGTCGEGFGAWADAPTVSPT